MKGLSWSVGSVSLAGMWLLLACLLLGHALPVTAQQRSEIVGRVVDAATGTPLASAHILVPAAGIQTLSAQNGTFRLHGLEGGTQELEIRMIGYGMHRASVPLQPGRVTEVEIALLIQPAEAPEIVADVRARPRSSELGGFWHRKERGQGVFITREAIDARQPTKLVELLQGIPGVQVIRTGRAGSGARISFARNTRERECPPAVYLDGMLVPISDLGLDEFPPQQVEAIEVYAGASRVPAEFNRTGRTIGGSPTCGVVVLWSRSASSDGSSQR